MYIRSWMFPSFEKNAWNVFVKNFCLYAISYPFHISNGIRRWILYVLVLLFAARYNLPTQFSSVAVINIAFLWCDTKLASLLGLKSVRKKEDERMFERKNEDDRMSKRTTCGKTIDITSEWNSVEVECDEKQIIQTNDITIYFISYKMII